MKKLIVFCAMLAFTAILTKAGGGTWIGAIARTRGDKPGAHSREQKARHFCETFRLCYDKFLSDVSRNMNDGSQYKACVDFLTKMSFSGQPVKTKLIRSYKDENMDFSIIEVTHGLDTLYVYVGFVNNGKDRKDDKILDMTTDKENVRNVMNLMDEMEGKKVKTNPRDEDDIAPKPAAVPSTLTYTVKEGEDLVSIAIAIGVSPSALMDLNGLKTPDELKPGQVLKLPANAKLNSVDEMESKTDTQNSRDEDDVAPKPAAVPSTLTYTVKEGEDLVSIAIALGVSPSVLMDLNGIKASDEVKPGQVLKLPADAKLQ